MDQSETQRRSRATLGLILITVFAFATLMTATSACRTAEEPAAVEAEVVVPPGIETLPLEVVIATRLNVRAGPGAEHPVVGKLPKGAQVRVLEQADGWKRVRPDEGGLEGWVAGEYLQAAPNP